ncbi:amidase [Kineococcus rhizosphaerae]|uniref:Amidase n=1 Tax=Kineococcus rhizosphaerae TaxID=559628 RepID=A0A2T0QWN0_9ACTN|nr:amidase [Kineococcus rhizosphaerae]
MDVTHVQTFTVQFNITGMPALSMRFGTSTDGLPIGVQIAGPWHAESTVLHVASVLESVSPVRGFHPALRTAVPGGRESTGPGSDPRLARCPTPSASPLPQGTSAVTSTAG